MIILIGGGSHSGRTLFAQRLLEKYHYPYLSIDHLKMGLIRSGQTALTPMDDEQLTDYLWPIVREMIKTAIENQQNLIVEGCYIPSHWRQDFQPQYLCHIRDYCLVMSRQYIRQHFDDICRHGSAIEQRLDDSGLRMEPLIRENEENLRLYREHGCRYHLLEDAYRLEPREILSAYSVRNACFADMALAAHIMVSASRAAFADFVSPETMAACTDPVNCRDMLEGLYQAGNLHFLMGEQQGFLCWQDTAEGAEIAALHTVPESWGTGLGHFLVKEALAQIGDRPVYLWALAENTRARRFYEKQGFRWDGTVRTGEFDGAQEVRYSRG